ncbi:suppressor of fused domain protein, partial [Albibacillus kandeliae]|uniref:suppressor of fused domain protein n=1 Tax=Albibacillus kandeliae TaxID=2174228 RepID=UPI0018E500F3
RAGSSTDKTAIVFCNDPELVSTDTPHGRLDFLQIIGITASELGDLQTKSISPQALIDKKAVSHPLLITALVEK